MRAEQLPISIKQTLASFEERHPIRFSANLLVSWEEIAQMRSGGYDVTAEHAYRQLRHMLREYVRDDKLDTSVSDDKSTLGREFRARIVIMHFDELYELLYRVYNEGVADARGAMEVPK